MGKSSRNVRGLFYKKSFKLRSMMAVAASLASVALNVRADQQLDSCSSESASLRASKRCEKPAQSGMVSLTARAEKVQLAAAEHGKQYGKWHVSDSVIRNAPATESMRFADANTPNIINTPKKGQDLKSLNAKQGKDLPLGTQKVGNEEKTLELEEVVVRAKRFHEIGPLPGLGLTKEEIPGNVQSISAKEIKDAHALSLTDLLNRKLQSVNVNDYQGNPFQMDVTYRGFTAGPQIGTPQGLSVFFDGIRVNEPFGDVVNWDMIPMNAIAGFDVFPGSNPIFGLNTLGGAFTMKTKDGFNNSGADAEILTGSFGRKQLQVEGGWNNGKVGLFAAGNFFLEDGWRKNSPSRVNQLFTKASFRGEKIDLSLSGLFVQNNLVGNGLLPSEMYAQDPTSIYSGRDTTKNNLAQFQLSGSYFVSDTFTVTGQMYRRNSKRNQRGADVFTGIENDLLARRIPSSSEQYTCLFTSTNSYKLPDYVVVKVSEADGFNLYGTNFYADYTANGRADFSLASYNQTLPDYYAKVMTEQYNGWKNYYEQNVYNRDNETPANDGMAPDYSGPTAGETSTYLVNDFTGRTFPTAVGDNIYFSDGNYYYSTETETDSSGNQVQVNYKNFVILTAPTNNENCLATQALDVASEDSAFTYLAPNTSTVATVDGAGSGTGGVVYEVDPDTGKKYYTPTSVLTDNQIDQLVNGMSLQLNWNLEHHKLMVGASIDATDAEYQNRQRLGLLTAERIAYLAPDDIHPMFVGADQWISNNNFSGNQTTKSVYMSETWSPTDNWHFSFSSRYNDTRGKNKIAARYGVGNYQIGDVIAYPDSYNICPNGDCTNVSTQYKTPNILNALNAAETEKFKYYSFNPQLGATWQARENLNVYTNYAMGTRVPSVIELGCAFDPTPTADIRGNIVAKSIAENRQCNLPSTLSGDPYLPQIKASTVEVGLRGNFSENVQWNVAAYQTNLRDDIYFVAIGNNGQGLFDSIGKTRRRGLEAGLSGRKDRLGFSLNYSLTDATFQNDFYMYSENNSSAIEYNLLGNGVIHVEPGDRMPGVPLHNLNATLNYDLTNNWSVGLTAIAHAESFVRGNENNDHQKGVVRTYTSIRQVDDGTGTGNTVAESFTRTLAPTSNPGTVPGYATFNLHTSYKFNKEWSATLLVNNLLDKEYFTAGRLGRNPFSPSILGAIGADGYNHNSDDWRSTNFIAPSAPRGIWLSVNWHFDAGKK